MGVTINFNSLECCVFVGCDDFSCSVRVVVVSTVLTVVLLVVVSVVLSFVVSFMLGETTDSFVVPVVLMVVDSLVVDSGV